MKKRYLSLILGLLAAAVMTVGVIFVGNKEKVVNSEPYLYSMLLNKDNQIQSLNTNSENYDIGVVKTKQGTDIQVAYSVFIDIDPSDAFVKMTKDEYIEIRAPLNGLVEVQYEIDGSLEIDLGYDLSGDYVGHTVLTSTEGHLHTEKLIEDMGDYGVPPCTFKMTYTGGSTLTIKSMKFIYTCTVYPNPTKQVGTWVWEKDGQVANITGFSIESEDIPSNRALIVPKAFYDGGQRYDVAKIAEGTLANVPWLDHIVLPFVGESYLLDQENVSYNFASIFGKNGAHNKYQPIQQYEGDKVNIWYVPKSLNKVTIAGGNIRFDPEDPLSSLRKYVPAYSFYGCASLLRTINITGDIQEFGEYSFTNCSAMKEIILPLSTIKINVGTFTGCNKVFIRCLANDVETVDGFNPNNRPISFGYSETFLDDGIYYDVCEEVNTKVQYLNVVGLSNDKEVVNIPSSVDHDGETYPVKRIANRAFENQTQVRAVHINNDIELVGNYVFQNCYRASVYLAENPTSRPNKYLPYWSEGLGGEVYLNYISYNDTDLHYYECSDARYVFGSEGSLSDELHIDVSDYHNTLIFPYYAFEGDVRVYEVTFGKDHYLKPYSFANCIHLAAVNFDGTMEEFEQFKADGKIGFNSFINIATTQAKCSDGYVSLD